MKKIAATAFTLLAGIAVTGLTPAPAKALVVYSYTGNSFDNIVDNATPAGSYTTSMSISGSFTVASALDLSTLTDISGLLLSYSFTDGRYTLDDSNSAITDFAIQTDASGTPVLWDIEIQDNSPTPTPTGFEIHDILTVNDSIDLHDAGAIADCTDLTNCLEGAPLTNTFDFGGVENAGTFTVSEVPDAKVPEPSALLLLGAGLTGLALRGRRRRRG